MAYDYDLIVIGAGSGGISAANLGLNLGKRVVLIEKRRIGGECTWSGCVPSKGLIKAAEVAHQIRHADRFGLKIDSSSLDAKRVMDHVRDVIGSIYSDETPEVFEEKGIDVVIGDPRFIDPHTITVGEKILTSKSFVIATGSSPFVPSIEGVADTPFLTNENVFELEALPASMIVLGGGPIGSELAMALNRLGVRITLVEKTGRILSKDDEELARMLMDRMTGEGVEIRCHARATGMRREGRGIVLNVETETGVETLKADALLAAVGRQPNVDGLDLEKAGVAYSEKGIQVDGALRTTAKNIYAIGDCIGSYQFSHMAEAHANVAVPNAVLPIPVKKRIDTSNVPWATFTDPELAHVGQTEAEAREQFGDRIRVYRFPFGHVDRARTDGADFGLAKFITRKNGKLLGINILGAHASDLLHEALLVKVLGLKFTKVQKMIHIYPTYGDVVKRPAGRLYGDLLRDNVIVKLIQKRAGK